MKQFSLRSLLLGIAAFFIGIALLDNFLFIMFKLKPSDYFREEVQLGYLSENKLEFRLMQRISDFYDRWLWIKINGGPWEKLVLIGKEESRVDSANMTFNREEMQLLIKTIDDEIAVTFDKELNVIATKSKLGKSVPKLGPGTVFRYERFVSASPSPSPPK